MTTPRTRRTKPQQAIVILAKHLHEQAAEVAKRRAALEEAEIEFTKTKQAMGILGGETLPVVGAETEAVPPETTAVNASAVDSEVTGTSVTVTRNTRQRIGAKALLRQGSVGQAQGISDVWSETPGETVVSVHTDLMYARQDLCEWCKAGVPFATKERTEHRNGSSYDKCQGV